MGDFNCFKKQDESFLKFLILFLQSLISSPLPGILALNQGRTAWFTGHISYQVESPAVGRWWVSQQWMPLFSILNLLFPWRVWVKPGAEKGHLCPWVAFTRGCSSGAAWFPWRLTSIFWYKHNKQWDAVPIRNSQENWINLTRKEVLRDHLAKYLFCPLTLKLEILRSCWKVLWRAAWMSNVSAHRAPGLILSL